MAPVLHVGVRPPPTAALSLTTVFMDPEPLPKLRMAPPETAEETAHRYERQQRAQNLQREANLENSLAPFRVGSV